MGHVSKIMLEILRPTDSVVIEHELLVLFVVVITCAQLGAKPVRREEW